MFIGTDLLWSSFAQALSATPGTFATTRSAAGWGHSVIDMLAQATVASAMFPGLVVSCQADA
jgi:hypothetical protein